jgi:hypothetical protein
VISACRKNFMVPSGGHFYQALLFVPTVDKGLMKSFGFRSPILGKTLFLRLKAPNKSVGASTVARWIMEVLTNSGIDVNLFSAHSTRGAAASKEFASEIPVERILKAGNWATESVFSRHFQRPVVEPEPDELAIVN